MTPVSELRIQAVEQIGKTEAADAWHTCSDTKAMLDELSETVDVGPVLMHQLRDAYCVHRTAQLLGGHEIDADEGALMRLGRWTVLDLRWPLLTAYLRHQPEAIEDLGAAKTPPDVPDDLRPLFGPGDPQDIGQGLSADAVRRFPRPLSATPPDAANGNVTADEPPCADDARLENRNGAPRSGRRGSLQHVLLAWAGERADRNR